MAAENPPVTKGGNYAGIFTSSSIIDPDLRSVLSDYMWTSDAAGDTPATRFTYFFPTDASQYPANYADSAGLSVFKVATPQQQAAALIGFDLISS